MSQLGLNLRRTRASWLQLEANWGPTWRNLDQLSTLGRKLGLTCATWSCVGASGTEAGSKRGICGEHGLAQTPAKAKEKAQPLAARPG